MRTTNPIVVRAGHGKIRIGDVGKGHVIPPF
jgi:hypothetical protein